MDIAIVIILPSRLVKQIVIFLRWQIVYIPTFQLLAQLHQKLKYVSFLVFDVALRFNLTCIIVTATVLALISAAIMQQAARAQISTIPGVLPEEQQQQVPQTQQQGASNVTTDFLTYENPDYDLKIRYTSNWDVKEYPNRCLVCFS